MNSYYFHAQNALSKIGTKKIINYYKSLGIRLYTVEDNDKFQNHDIDLIMKENDKFTTIEVKVDRYQSGNFFLETMSNKEKGIPGCLLTTKSEKLYYYFINMKKLYIFNTEDLKDWILKNKCNYREFPVETPVGGGYYTTLGIPVPISTLVKELNLDKDKDVIII